MAQREPRPPWRPTKLTEELSAQLLKLVGQGWPIEMAARKCGVSRQTVLEWVRRGSGLEDEDRPPKKLYVDFANRYEQVRAEYFGFLLGTYNEAIAGVRPKKGPDGRPLRGPDGKPVRMVKATGLTFASADRALKILSRRWAEFYGSGLEQFAAIEARSEDAAAATALPPKITIILAPDAGDDAATEGDAPAPSPDGDE